MLQAATLSGRRDPDPNRAIGGACYPCHAEISRIRLQRLRTVHFRGPRGIRAPSDKSSIAPYPEISGSILGHGGGFGYIKPFFFSVAMDFALQSLTNGMCPVTGSHAEEPDSS